MTTVDTDQFAYVRALRAQIDALETERDEAVARAEAWAADVNAAEDELADRDDSPPASDVLRRMRADLLDAATTDPRDPAWDLYFEIDRRIDVAGL